MNQELAVDVVRHYHEFALTIAKSSPLEGALFAIDRQGAVLQTVTLDVDRENWPLNGQQMKDTGAVLIMAIFEAKKTDLHSMAKVDIIQSSGWLVDTEFYVTASSVTWDWDFWIQWCGEGEALRPRPFEPTAICSNLTHPGFRFTTNWIVRR